MRKFAIGLVAAVLTSAAAMGAPIQEKPVNIVMVVHMPAANDFTAVVRNGAELAAEQMGVHLQFLSNETFDMVWMSQTLAEVVGKRPDGIATTLPDAGGLGELDQTRRKRGYSGRRPQWRRARFREARCPQLRWPGQLRGGSVGGKEAQGSRGYLRCRLLSRQRRS